jgi:branched-chain amino acid transport system permease protein
VQTFAVAINVSLADVLRTVGISVTRDSPGGDLWMATVAQVAPIIPYLLLVLVLIFRPKGLLGDRDT